MNAKMLILLRFVLALGSQIDESNYFIIDAPFIEPYYQDHANFAIAQRSYERWTEYDPENLTSFVDGLTTLHKSFCPNSPLCGSSSEYRDDERYLSLYIIIRAWVSSRNNMFS